MASAARAGALDVDESFGAPRRSRLREQLEQSRAKAKTDARAAAAVAVEEPDGAIAAAVAAAATGESVSGPRTPPLAEGGPSHGEWSPGASWVEALAAAMGLSPVWRQASSAAASSSDPAPAEKNAAAGVSAPVAPFSGSKGSMLKRRRGDDAAWDGLADRGGDDDGGDVPLSIQVMSHAQLLLDSFGHVRSPAGAVGSLHAREVGGGGWCFYKAFADQLGSVSIRGHGYLAVLALVEVAKRRAEFVHTVPGSLFQFAEEPEVLAARQALTGYHRYRHALATLAPFDVVLLDKFEGVLSGDLSASRRYADMYEIISLVESCGLELLLVEGSDAPGARAMRTRVYPTMDTCDAAVPRLRDGIMDMVFVRYEAGAWQHYQSVRFADASPWRVAAETRRRVEQRVADCQVCSALSRGQRDVARTLMLSLPRPACAARRCVVLAAVMRQGGVRRNAAWCM